MTCPVCGSPTATARLGDDERCGPCFNFKIVGFTKFGAALIEVDFDKWCSQQVDDIRRANNLDTYRPWLLALRIAQQRAEEGR